MSDVGFNEAYRISEFVVEIEGMESTGITKVRGLSEGRVDPIEQSDAGTNTTHEISSDIVQYDDLILERNMDGSQADEAFRTWFSTMFALDGTGRGSGLRRNGSVIVKHFGDEVLRFAFEGAWIKSSQFSDLDAGSSELMKQTLILSIERMYRV